jgi:hypothetical protein
MNKLAYLTMIALCIMISSACAQTTPQPIADAKPESENEEINPGDKIGDFLITTGEPDDVTFQWELDSKVGEGSNTYLLEVPLGTKVIPTVGIYDDTYKGKLDEKWDSLTYEISLDDHPVNLSAFGTIEVRHPTAGQMRHYNVVIVAEKPGSITIHEKWELQGKSEEWNGILKFVAPDATNPE